MGWFFNKKSDDVRTGSVEKQLEFSKKLQAVTNKIHATSNLDEIMLDLSKDICDLFNCERMTLYAISNDRNFIFSKVKTGIDTNKDLVLPLNTDSIAGYVALLRKSVRINDVYDEAELEEFEPELKFCRDVDQITGYRTRQMLCAPLVSASSREFLGVLQLINSRDEAGFTEADEDGLIDLCETMAIAFIQRMKAVQAVRSKYEALIVDSIISAAELDLAASWARRKSLDIEDALIDEFQVPLTAIGESLSKAYKIPYEKFKPDRAKPVELLKKVARSFAEKNQWLPLLEEKRGLITILTTDPEGVKRTRVINEIFPYGNFFYRVTTKREFAQTVEQLYAVVAEVKPYRASGTAEEDE
ncbi:hypothetical protein BH11PSE11_BH11PSE11_05290 [soil metagenome]